jgi:protein TonB
MSYLSQTPYRRQQPQKSGRLVGLAVVVVLHIGLIYALASGLARDVVQLATEPLETKIIEEVTPPPPEPPPPPPPPQFDTPPPPPFMPKVEIQITQPPPPTAPVATVTNERPPEVRPPAPNPTPAPAPPAPPTGGKVDKASLSKYRAEYPAQSIRLEEAGTTILQLFCNEEGRISDATVQKSSGYERLDNAWIKEAKRGRWKCEPPVVDGKPRAAWIPSPVGMTFRLEDAR